MQQSKAPFQGKVFRVNCQIALSQPRGHSGQTGPQVVSTDRRDAEIRSTAYSERSSLTWSQQASLIPLPPFYPKDRFSDTVSTVKTVEQTHTSPNGDQDRPVQAQDLAAYGTE